MPALSTYRAPGVYVEWLDTNPQSIDIARTDVAGFIGMAERGPLHAATKVESTRQFLTTFGAHIPQSYLAYAIEGYFANGGRSCWVVRVANPFEAQHARIRIASPSGAFVLQATSRGSWGNNVRLSPIWAADRIIGLTMSEGVRSQDIMFDAQTNAPSKLIRVKAGPPGINASWPELASDNLVDVLEDDREALPLTVLGSRSPQMRLEGGADGLQSLKLDHFTGDDDHPFGIRPLERVEEVSFVAAPDLNFRPDVLAPNVDFKGFQSDAVRDAQIEILSSCMRTRDRIAILDGPPVGPRDILQYRKDMPENSFGALYHPWIVANDPLRIRSNATRAIPPSGHIAGMFARVDRMRGVHKAPANEALEAVWDVTHGINDEVHGDLNTASINAIRAIPGRGVLVMGARTLDTDLRWRYVNVRRLFAMIEEALDEQMQWLTFEANNRLLWRQVDRALRGFLERLYRAGMLDGASADDAYFVRCDETTNPPFVTDDGQVVSIIGIQPPFPAEFIVVRVGITRSGIEIEEKGAQDA